VARKHAIMHVWAKLEAESRHEELIHVYRQATQLVAVVQVGSLRYNGFLWRAFIVGMDR